MVVTSSRARADPQPAARASSAPSAGEGSCDAGEEAVREATSALPLESQFSFKPSYTFPNGSRRYAAELQFEPLLRYRGLLIPDLDVPGFWSVARVQLSAASQQNEVGVASGLGDLTFTDLFARAFGVLRAGLGFATIFPMATSPSLGHGKWQLGPALGLDLRAVRSLRLAVLVQNFYSVAGSSQSPTLGYVTVQPFITLDLPGDCFVETNATMNFYWRGGKTTVPLNLGFGRAFSGRFVGSLQGWYTVAGNGEGDVRGRAVLTFLWQ
jgi:hypothetical protein